jgi:hypothetical protein
MPVRPLAEADIPQIAELYWKVLRERKGPAPPGVHSFLSELYFRNPWIDGNISSLVYEEKGRVGGFLGVVPRRMCFRGDPIVIAYGGNFVVDPDFRTTLAGLHLLRTYMAGPQDLSQTDSANDTSRTLLERLGFTTVVPYSMYWVRLLRPVRSVTHAIAEVAESAVTSSLDFIARPISAVADRLAATASISPFRQVESRLQATEFDVDTLLTCLTECRQGYSLWPEYRADSLQWLLDFMRRMKGHGEDLRKTILRDESGKIVGWYIYYRTKGGFGGVAQVGGTRQRIREVLDHLFHDAWSYGVIALQGVVERRLITDFSEKNCFFTCRGGWTVAYSRKPHLLEALNNADAFLSRLDGEWCLAFGG